MRNHVQPGNALDFVAPAGGVVSGVPLIIGNLFVVPSTSALEGEAFSGDLVGVFEFVAATHATTQAAAVGAKYYWDDTAKKVTVTATGNILIGNAAEVHVSTVALAKVRLNGVSLPAAS